MGLRLFWRKLMGDDARIDYYARIVAALIVSVDRLSYEELDRTKLIAGRLFMRKDEEGAFVSRVFLYLEHCVKGELHLNQLIRRIDQIHRQHPRWIEAITPEVVSLCEVADEPLQLRVVEFLQALRRPPKRRNKKAAPLKDGATSSRSPSSPPRPQST